MTPLYTFVAADSQLAAIHPRESCWTSRGVLAAKPLKGIAGDCRRETERNLKI